ncbi:MAG: alpha/beta hydrolase domain-containing protein [Acidobacteria bacterium]|nr:alpha/beta hydrolase domain-containing protein [Acidobacteriota bacterium]
MHIILLLLGALLAAPAAVDARVTRIEIEHVESPTFDGRAFGDAGPYEKLVGRVHAEVDPEAPESVVIADIELAPRNARGKVEYSADLIILRPVDPSRGNGRLFYETNNRGRLLSLNRLNNAPTATSDPTSGDDAGNGFLMRQGYTFVASGWDATASAADGRLNITLPVAVNADGSPIVGPSLEELVIDNDNTATGRLTYPAATRDTSQAKLTVRTRYTDEPRALAPDAWEYVDARTIRLLPAGTAFRQGSLYHLTYPATDPMVAGLGFAAVRDVVAFLRHADADDAGNANPLSGQLHYAHAFAISQPARFMRDFVHYGFNRDTTGRRVFDGVLNWIGGASGAFVNYRFAQPHRTQRQHTARWFPERPFPFAYNVTHDPVTERTDGRLRRCLDSGTCPQILEANSSNEYWVKASSLLHTDTLGDDLPDPPNVRLYLFSSFPHSGGSRQRGMGICQQPRNTLEAEPVLRALLVALDEWVTAGKDPPASRVPRRADATLVEALPREHLGFPAIPGVHYDGLMSTGDLLDFGTRAGEGILSALPPAVTEPYPALVPRTDADGNDMAGIRVPDVAAPLATYTGWAVRAAEYAGNDLCDAAGQELAFPGTRAERLERGDPRPSIEERYGSHDGYVEAVERATRALQQNRLLLAEDVERIIAAARQRSLD